MTGQSGQLEVWDTKAAVEAQWSKQTAESAATMAPTKPLYVLWAPAHSSQMMQISSAHLLAVPGRIGDVHVSLVIHFLPCKIGLLFPSRFLTTYTIVTLIINSWFDLPSELSLQVLFSSFFFFFHFRFGILLICRQLRVLPLSLPTSPSIHPRQSTPLSGPALVS